MPTRNTQSVPRKPAIVEQIKRNNNLPDPDVACHSASNMACTGSIRRVYDVYALQKCGLTFSSLLLLFYSIPATFAYIQLVYYFRYKFSQAARIVSPPCRGQDIPLKVYHISLYVLFRNRVRKSKTEKEKEKFHQNKPHTNYICKRACCTGLFLALLFFLFFSLFLLEHFLQPPPLPQPPPFVSHNVLPQTLFHPFCLALSRSLSVTHCPSVATMCSMLPTVLVT